MVDAGIESGDYILIQFTGKLQNGDRVRPLLRYVTVKRLERRDGMTVLWPESRDPNYKPIVCVENSK